MRFEDSERVCACFEHPDKAQWFVWDMRRRNVARFAAGMLRTHNLTLRAIVRRKRP